ncbi:MAG: metal ABC transporter substrate-binding protein [Archaeoglobus sp.]|nr:metal ABC transporter substrate-binding protein [Archaeoglobus sp.]
MIRKFVNSVFFIFIVFLPQSAVALDIVCTNPDFVPIVKEIGGSEVSVTSLLPPGSDPHSFSISKSDMDRLKASDLIILTNSELFSFEKKIKAEYAEKVLDFSDYSAEGARLDDFPGFRNNPHGYWLKIENAVSIARAVEKKLSRLYPEKKDYFGKNLELFVEKMDDLKEVSSKVVGVNYGKNTSCLAVIPGVTYIIENAGLRVGAVLMGEGLGFASGKEYAEIQDKLKSDELSCIVVPESMKKSKAGEIAEQLSRDSGKPVVYVKFVVGAQDVDYSEIQIYNLIAFAKAFSVTKSESIASSQELLYILILMVLIEAAVIVFLWRAG